MTKKQTVILAVAVAIVAAGAGALTWWLMAGRQSAVPPADGVATSTTPAWPLTNGITPRDPALSNEQNLIKDYLTNHLSELSPTKEVLGGKFYLTRITFPQNNQAIIDYEDGHIALQAKIGYEIGPKKLKITSFKVIKEN